VACWAAYAWEKLLAGVPSSELETVVLSRGSTEALPGERPSLLVSPASLTPSVSLARDVCVFLRLGVGMRHSMEKAVQLVHGTPREAASQRTCAAVTIARRGGRHRDYSLCANGTLFGLSAFVASIIIARPRCRGCQAKLHYRTAALPACLLANKACTYMGRLTLACSTGALSPERGMAGRNVL
jgi:hypothetical protein